MIRMFDSTSLPALEQTAIFAQRRHELLAGNVANLDTPDYRAKDMQVDRFQQALADSIEAAKRPSPGYALPTLTSQQSSADIFSAMSGATNGKTAGGSLASVARSLSGGERDDFVSGPRDAMEPIVLHDGSDVSLERQVTEIAKNQGLHNLAIATMRSQFALLRTAITERA
jgi:flagellar basal-body rod protein FlgB